MDRVADHPARIRLTPQDIARYAQLEAMELNRVVHTGMLKQRHESDRRHIRMQNILILSLLIGTVIAWFSVRVWFLRRMYALQFEVFESKRFHDTPQVPAGVPNYDLGNVALAVEYPSLFAARNAIAMGSASISPTGAQFLLLMLGAFPDRINRIHWAGTGEQLQTNLLDDFAQRYGAWASGANAFAWLLPDEAAWSTSRLLCEYRKKQHGEGSDLKLIFNGGLCRFAQVRGMVRGETAARMVQRLIGRRVVLQKDCDAARMEAAVASATNVVGAGATMLGLVSTAGASLFTGVGAIAAAGILVATGVGAATLGNYSHRTKKCSPTDSSASSADAFESNASRASDDPTSTECT